jgi:hypothetical protein
MNKLDNKLILDRQFALELLDCLDVNDLDHGQVAQKLHEIMSAQDNTGWAAVRVDASDEERMLPAPWRYPLLLRGWHYMLAASPPLLETKRETK